MPFQVEVPSDQALLAAKALLKHLAEDGGDGPDGKPSNSKRSIMDLLPEERTVWLQVGLKRVPTTHKHKAQRIPLEHSLYDHDTAEICLFTKDPEEQFAELVKEKMVDGNIQVMGLAQLKAKHKTYEQQRQLCSSYDLFLADDRIIHLLPRLLGKKFFLTKKKPVPVKMQRKELAKEIAYARDSTYLHLTTGPSCAVRVGHTGMTPQQIADNIVTAYRPIINAIPRKDQNIQSLHIKADNSISLPLYSSLAHDAAVVEQARQMMPKKRKAEDDGASAAAPVRQTNKSSKTASAAEPAQDRPAKRAKKEAPAAKPAKSPASKEWKQEADERQARLAKKKKAEALDDDASTSATPSKKLKTTKAAPKVTAKEHSAIATAPSKAITPAKKAAKSAPASAKKAPASAKKAPASAKKAPASAKKAPASAKKAPASAKKAPASAKKGSASAKKKKAAVSA